MASEAIPDIVVPGDRPAQASGCPLAWEGWFAGLSTWATAACEPRWNEARTVRLTALGGLVHVHAVLDWDGATPVDVGQPCAEDSVFLVSDGRALGAGFMAKGTAGIIPNGMSAGKIVLSGWYPAELGDDR